MLLLSDLRQLLCAHRICRQEGILLGPLNRDSHTHKNVSVEETVQLLYEVTDMLIVLASSGWRQLMVFYFQVISSQWKRNTWLFPDGIWVEETEQNDSKQNEWNEKPQLKKKGAETWHVSSHPPFIPSKRRARQQRLSLLSVHFESRTALFQAGETYNKCKPLSQRIYNPKGQGKQRKMTVWVVIASPWRCKAVTSSAV